MKLGRGGTALCATDSAARSPLCRAAIATRPPREAGCEHRHSALPDSPQPSVMLHEPRAARRPRTFGAAALSTCAKHSLETPPKPHVPRAGWMEKGSACTHHLRLSGNRPAPRPWRRVQSDARIVHAGTALTEIPKVSFQRRLGATDAKDSDWDKSASLIIVIIVCLGRCWCAHQTDGKHRSDQQADAPGHD